MDQAKPEEATASASQRTRKGFSRLGAKLEKERKRSLKERLKYAKDIQQDKQNPGQFVVYQLVDPRNGNPFYIGSGKPGRPYEHVPQALNGEAGKKADRIRELLNEGMQPKVEILANTTGRNHALDIEATLIRSTHGLLNKAHNARGVSVNLRDEFCASIVLNEPHKTKRISRIARIFTDKDTEGIPGHKKMLTLARQHTIKQAILEAAHGR